jgi:O-antigen ligase
LICVLALILNTARSAVLSAIVALAQTFLLVRWRQKLYLLLLSIGAAGMVMLAMAIGILSTEVFKHFYDSIVAGAAGVDGSSKFRMERWQYVVQLWKQHPILGNGFGVPLAVSSLLAPKEAQGQFNVGMPHNTFLFLLARTGIVGLALVVFGWVYAWCGLVGTNRRDSNPDSLALANILVSMATFAGFVLFFERPMNGASFWIMVAAATKLMEPRGVG